MNFNIFRNPFIHNRMKNWEIEKGYEELARQKELSAKRNEDILDLQYWMGYNSGYMDGYNDAAIRYRES
jgi:hypothetical protein